MTPQHHLLRASIESNVTSPAVILVTSARARDGKSVTAYGLAESLDLAGHRVALVDADPGSPASLRPVNREALGRVSLLRMPRDAGDPRKSRTAIAGLASDLRDAYDYAIIDGTTFLGSGAGIQLASICDGVLLSVRVGRRQVEEDRLMVRTLQQSRAIMLGVVAVEPEQIALFQHARHASSAPEPRLLPFEQKSDDVPVAARLVHER